MENLIDMLGGSRYQPLASCLTNDAVIEFLYTFANAVSSVLLVVVAMRLWKRRRRGFYLLPHQSYLVSVLIVLYAVTHATGGLLTYVALYRLDVVLHGLTLGLLVVLTTSACWRRA